MGPTCFLTFAYPSPWTHGQNEPHTSEPSASISPALRVDSQNSYSADALTRKAGLRTFRKDRFDCANELRFPHNIHSLVVLLSPTNFFVKLTYNRSILRFSMESQSKGCFIAISH